MSKEILLPVFYLPPIAWFSVYFNDDTGCVLEQFENLPKQTYRNRAEIYGANGRLSLIIPIQHDGKRVYKDIRMSERENWRKIHWKSIKNAYQSSPYFEYYESQLEQIYGYKGSSLLEFNLNAVQIILKILKSEKAYRLNTEYAANPAAVDLRSFFNAKNPEPFGFQEYYQTFSDKMGFLENLSIIDLLCNKGPESIVYLRNNEIDLNV